MNKKLAQLFDLYLHFLQTVIDGIDICFENFLKKLGIKFSYQKEHNILYH